MNSSTFADIELGKRGVLTHQRAFATVGHNLANLETEGYTRQRVHIQSSAALYAPDLSRNGRLGQIGSGSEIVRIERIRDQLLDQQIFASNDGLSFWETRETYLGELAQILQEPDDTPVRKVMDLFWQGWQELAHDPASVAAREQLLQRGVSLADHIRSRYQRLDALETKMDQHLQQQVQEVNQLLANIAKLNGDIQRSLAIGDQPNDLLDRRDLLAEKLSGYLDMSVEPSRDADEYLIHLQGQHLVQGKVYHPLAIEQLERNRSQIIWADESVPPPQLLDGSLAALLQLRDEDLANSLNELNQLALHYADLVNQIHREASGLDGLSGRDFFTYYRLGDPQNGNYDSDGDGIEDSTVIYRLSGGNRVDGRRSIGIAGELVLNDLAGNIVTVPYQPDDTLNEVIQRINRSDAALSARLNHRQQLEFRPRLHVEQMQLNFLQDNGQLLSSLAGLLAGEAAFDARVAGAVNNLAATATWEVAAQKSPAAWLQVNEQLLNDTSKIATAVPTGGRVAVGNNQAALDIAALAHLAVMPGEQETVADFYAQRIARIGEQGQAAAVFRQTFASDLQNLHDLRQAISGVSLDEEFSAMIRFQRGYEAAARFLNSANELLDIIINRMGVA